MTIFSYAILSFFGFGATQMKNKPQPTTGRVIPNATQVQPNHPIAGSIAKRRGSDRSLSGSTQELALPIKVIHSQSQSNITDVANR